MGFFFNREKKKYKDGIKDGAKPFEDKFSQVGNDIDQSNKDVDEQLQGMKETVEQTNDSYEKVNQNVESMNENVNQMDENIQQTGKNVTQIIKQMSQQQKFDLFQLDSKYDVSNLSATERQFLIGYLFTVSQNFNVNELQKKYVSSLMHYLEVTEPQIGVNLDSIDNVENISTQKIILKIIMEYCALNDSVNNQGEVFGLFSVNNKAKSEIEENVDRMIGILGIQGLSNRFDIQEEQENIEQQEELLKKQESLKKENDEKLAAIAQQKQKLEEQRIQDEKERKQREQEKIEKEKRDLDQIKRIVFSKANGVTEEAFGVTDNKYGIITYNRSEIQYRFKTVDETLQKFTFDGNDDPSGFAFGIDNEFYVYSSGKIYYSMLIDSGNTDNMHDIERFESGDKVYVTGKTIYPDEKAGEVKRGKELIDMIKLRDKRSVNGEFDVERGSSLYEQIYIQYKFNLKDIKSITFKSDDSNSNLISQNGKLTFTFYSGKYFQVPSEFSIFKFTIFGTKYYEKSSQVAQILMKIGNAINIYYNSVRK